MELEPKASPFRPSRRQVIVAGSAIAAGVAASSATAMSAAAAAPSGGTAPRPAPTDPLVDPAAQHRVWVRWPLGPSVTNSELERELEQMHAAGIAGAEIGQGTFPPIDQVGVILRKATALGMSIGLSHGPVSAPEDFSIDDDNARKDIVHGVTTVSGGGAFHDQLPTPTPVTSNRKTLVAVIAYRVVGTWRDGATNSLDHTTATDLTARVTARDRAGIGGRTTSGVLSWTAPAGGTWAIVTLWAVGSIAQPDLLTDAGRRVLTDEMDRRFAAIKTLLRENRGDLFYDSHTGDRGSPTDTWSNTLAADFRRLRGYSVLPYLALLTRLPASGFGAAPSAFEFADTVVATKFRNDFAQVRTDLWIATQVIPLQRWAKDYNQTIRLQPYGDNGPAVDAIQAAGVLDRVETETLWFGDEVDNYLPEAGAVHLLRKKWYSIEGSAVLNGAYAMTWQDQVVHMNKAFAGGVTKLVYHIYPYRDSSTAVWPGWSLFPDSFGNSWGPRSPHWKDAPDYNAYFARTQQVLVRGEAQRDVAVYLHNFVWPQPYTVGNIQYWSDPRLERSGYTRDYLNPTLLAHENATVRKGVLAPDGPAYRALILDGTQLPESAPSRNSIPADTARRILAFGKAGLPIIIVGAAPAGVPGIDPSGDAEVRKTVTKLLALPTTHRVATEGDVPALLMRLGIRPAARPAADGPVLSVHRREADTDWYWLYNQGSVISAGAPANTYDPATTGSPVSTEFTLTGRGVPLRYDPWTGEVTPIVTYRVGNGTITVPVHLDVDATTVIILTQSPKRFGVAGASSVHALTTTADAVVRRDGNLEVEARRPGAYTTTLSTGRRVSTVVSSVPAAIDLTGAGWRLDVEDWRPAGAYGTTGVAGTVTSKPTVGVSLGGLRPWTAIPELADASGVGTYRVTFDVPTTWKGSRIDLSLGSVTDSFTVSVNGRTIPFVDQIATVVDVSDSIRVGHNTLEITVATTLINRLRTLNPKQASWPQQANGLVGPVTLTPVVRRAVVSRS